MEDRKVAEAISNVTDKIAQIVDHCIEAIRKVEE